MCLVIIVMGPIIRTRLLSAAINSPFSRQAEDLTCKSQVDEITKEKAFELIFVRLSPFAYFLCDDDDDVDVDAI